MSNVTLDNKEMKLILAERYRNGFDKGFYGEEELGKAIDWLMSAKLHQLTTAEAFDLSEKKTVICIDADGVDYELEADDQDEHYPDKSKNYPEIETIFVIEGSL